MSRFTVSASAVPLVLCGLVMSASLAACGKAPPKAAAAAVAPVAKATGVEPDKVVKLEAVDPTGFFGTWKKTSVSFKGDSGFMIVDYIQHTPTEVIIHRICAQDGEYVQVTARSAIEIHDGAFKVLKSDQKTVDFKGLSCMTGISPVVFNYELSDNDNTLKLSSSEGSPAIELKRFKQ